MLWKTWYWPTCFPASAFSSPSDVHTRNGDLDLLLRGDKHGNPVHVEISLAEGLPVVGDEDQAAAPGHIAKDLDYRMYQIVRIDDGVVVGVHQLPGVGFRHLHGGTYGLERLELGRIFLCSRSAVARAGVEHESAVCPLSLERISSLSPASRMPS